MKLILNLTSDHLQSRDTLYPIHHLTEEFQGKVLSKLNVNDLGLGGLSTELARIIADDIRTPIMLDIQWNDRDPNSFLSQTAKQFPCLPIEILNARCESRDVMRGLVNARDKHYPDTKIVGLSTFTDMSEQEMFHRFRLNIDSTGVKDTTQLLGFDADRAQGIGFDGMICKSGEETTVVNSTFKGKGKNPLVISSLQSFLGVQRSHLVNLVACSAERGATHAIIPVDNVDKVKRLIEDILERIQ